MDNSRKLIEFRNPSITLLIIIFILNTLTAIIEISIKYNDRYKYERLSHLIIQHITSYDYKLIYRPHWNSIIDKNQNSW